MDVKCALSSCTFVGGRLVVPGALQQDQVGVVCDLSVMSEGKGKGSGERELG